MRTRRARVLGFSAITTLVLVTGWDSAAGVATADVTSGVPCATAAQATPSAGTSITDFGGIAVPTPAPGHGVSQDAYLTTGSQDLTVARNADGTLIVTDCGDDSANVTTSGGVSPLTSPAPCSDTAYNLLSFEWTSTFHWSYENNTTPSELTTAQAEDAIEDGRQAITQNNNDCLQIDDISATQAYDGHITGGNNVQTDGTCAAGNGTSVANFQDLPNTHLGDTCTYFNVNTGVDTATESDVSFNKVDFTWVVGDGGANCTNKYSLHSVATHESGHTFGLDHVSEASHGNLTMSPDINGPCQQSEYTLGKGDILGLRQRY
jgi:hypothetical protein